MANREGTIALYTVVVLRSWRGKQSITFQAWNYSRTHQEHIPKIVDANTDKVPKKQQSYYPTRPYPSPTVKWLTGWSVGGEVPLGPSSLRRVQLSSPRASMRFKTPERLDSAPGSGSKRWHDLDLDRARVVEEADEM